MIGSCVSPPCIDYEGSVVDDNDDKDANNDDNGDDNDNYRYYFV